MYIFKTILTQPKKGTYALENPRKIYKFNAFNAYNISKGKFLSNHIFTFCEGPGKPMFKTLQNTSLQAKEVHVDNLKIKVPIFM